MRNLNGIFLFLFLTAIVVESIPVVHASLPYPDIALTRTVFNVGEDIPVRVRVLTVIGSPTPISGLRLVFNTPTGVLTSNVDTINTDTWYTVTVKQITKTPGTYTVVGQLPLYQTNSGTLTFTVTQAEDFSISTSPTVITLKQGEKASFSITVNPIGGFRDSVRLSVTGLPSGTTISFTVQSGNLPLTSTATVDVLSSTPEGSYPLTIEASGGSKSHSTKVTLNVEKKPSLLEQLLNPKYAPLIPPAAIIGAVILLLLFIARRRSRKKLRPGAAAISERPAPPPPSRLSPPPPPPSHRPPSIESTTNCINCGASIPQQAKFCRKCGATQRESAPKCPDCDKDLSWIPQYRRYYCSFCAKYPPAQARTFPSPQRGTVSDAERYSPDEVMKMFRGLKRMRESGQVKEDEYSSLLSQMRFQDETGRYWMIDRDGEAWYYYDGSRWVPGEPSSSLR